MTKGTAWQPPEGSESSGGLIMLNLHFYYFSIDIYEIIHDINIDLYNQKVRMFDLFD